ncbi:hypothetical protein [Macrococcus animalis]|uniref:hypothetical protein n=1 Tax=Macrococcus animalis TaxID=3395467 RepID=UPI0039BDBD58
MNYIKAYIAQSLFTVTAFAASLVLAVCFNLNDTALIMLATLICFVPAAWLTMKLVGDTE